MALMLLPTANNAAVGFFTPDDLTRSKFTTPCLTRNLYCNPCLPLSHYDNVEVAGCIDHDGVTERVESDDDRLPNFWSVYFHLREEGGCECVVDCPSEREAIELADFLLTLLRSV